MKFCPLLYLNVLTLSTLVAPAQASPSLIAIGTLSQPNDLSGLTGTVESGDAASVLGGIGSGLAWAGGSTFLAIPDRGPNATGWTSGSNLVDNTTSYISRFQTVNLSLVNTPSSYNGGTLPFTLTPTLTKTTLLSSPTALNYAPANAANNNIAGTPSINTASQYFFTGRSDNFLGSGSTNAANGRLDPESIRVSNDGTKVYVSDEYGPYVYEFDRATGQRTHVYTLPSYYAVSSVSAQGATEISGNTTGRVANKGMEGLAITPDGKTLVGFMQSPLIQDGGDGGRANRIVTIDIATGTTHEYVYDNKVGSNTYNSSEILALNSHQFLVLERDGKGLGDGRPTVLKSLYSIDLNHSTEITPGLSGEASLTPLADTKSLFLDLAATLENAGVGLTPTTVPAKLESAAFGQDVTIGGVINHTLYVANDNDFVPGTAGPNNFYVFAFTDADTGGAVFQNQQIPEPGAALLVLTALGAWVATRRPRLTLS